MIATALLAGCVSPSPDSSLANDKYLAKNVILMVSDGIGFNGWLATDYYQGKAGSQPYQVTRPDGTRPVVYGMTHTALNLINGEGNILRRGSDLTTVSGAVEQIYDPQTRWLSFQNAMANDFEPDKSVYTSYTDSAAAGTALMTGRKTSNGRINMDWRGEAQFETIAEIAMKQGRSAGAVASVMASHATPAAVIAHNESRNNHAAIFNEMFSSDLAVIMGAGHPDFGHSGEESSEEAEALRYQYVGGLETFTTMRETSGQNGFLFVDSKAGFDGLAMGQNLPERVVGIAEVGMTLQARREGLGEANTPSGMAFNDHVPDLATMSVGALNVLGQNEVGFFVMIEGGAVDWMGHANVMTRFIEEQRDFNQAIDAVIAWVEENSSWQKTLLIITADHETGGIWGEGTWTNSEGGPMAESFTPEEMEAARFDPDKDVFNEFLAVQDRGAGNIPGHQFSSRNHTNDLVPLWAIGAGSEGFAQFTRTDVKAGKLWGNVYNWNGDYVDNTSVFQVMEDALGHE
jgi:alkaline phosphatase